MHVNYFEDDLIIVIISHTFVYSLANINYNLPLVGLDRNKLVYMTVYVLEIKIVSSFSVP